MTINELDYNKIYELVNIIRPDYDELDINSLIANAKSYKRIYTILSNHDGYIIIDKDYLVFEAKFHDVDYVKEVKYPNMCYVTLNLGRYGMLEGVYDINKDFYVIWDESKGEIPFEFVYDDETGDLFFKIKNQ